jgi:hypothetical protein
MQNTHSATDGKSIRLRTPDTGLAMSGVRDIGHGSRRSGCPPCAKSGNIIAGGHFVRKLVISA